MSFFVRATAVARPTNRVAFFATQLAVAALTVVAVAQLFTYEDFPLVLSAYLLPGGYPTASLLAAVLVTVEVLTAPYLLAMRLSPLMRLLSFVCGLTSCLIWLVLGVRLISQGNNAINDGLLGATFAVSTGWLPLLFTIVLAVGIIAAGPAAFRRTAWRR
jgi:hypothetical protein